jgi:diketogulonate reductase-like aldo/keto reductase
MEDALEESYHRGQEEMVDRFRAEYRTLTRDDIFGLTSRWGDDPLRAAMKQSFLKQVVECPLVPLDVFLIVKSIVKTEENWKWWRIAAAEGYAK